MKKKIGKQIRETREALKKEAEEIVSYDQREEMFTDPFIEVDLFPKTEPMFKNSEALIDCFIAIAMAIGFVCLGIAIGLIWSSGIK